MSEWKNWHIKLNEAIEIPTSTQLNLMNSEHSKMYQLAQKIKRHKELLSEYEEEFNDLKEQLDIKKLPSWCWIWQLKNSRVSWKQEFINRLGKTAANKLSATAKTKTTPQIGIRFIDPNPDQIPIDPEAAKRQEKPKKLKLTPLKTTPLLKLKLKG